MSTGGLKIAEVKKCAIHKNTDTYLTCAECGKPICPDCMVQTPVGAKCPDCAKHRGRTAGYVKPIYYLRAAGAGFGIGSIAGIILQFIPFFTIILGIVTAMFLAEMISRAVRRNSGPWIQVIGALSAAWMFFLADFFPYAPVLTASGVHIFSGRIEPIGLLIGLAGVVLVFLRLGD